MRCSNCGRENAEGAKFCNECGTALLRACESCGTPNAPDAKFCGECGSPLAASAPAVERTAPAVGLPASERRLVTVLFADLVGFTTFPSRATPRKFASSCPRTSIAV